MRQALGFSLGAVFCFHLAYTPAQSGLLAFAIVGYAIGLVQLARLRTTRQCFYVAMAVGFACFGPQLKFFWNIFGPAAIALWLILALWIALFVVITHVAIVQLGWKRAAFLTPFFWTGLEYFRSELYYLKFSWLNVGYAFAESSFVPWTYLGVFGIGFLTVAVATFFLTWRGKIFGRITLAELIVIVLITGVLAALIFFGCTGMLKYNKPSLVAAGVQLEFPESSQTEKSLEKAVVVSEQQRTRCLRHSTNTDLVVLPEYTLDGEPTDALKD